MRRAQHDVLQFLQRLRAEGSPPVPERARRRRPPRTRPRHHGQVPGLRDDHLPGVRVRHQRHQDDGADHESPGQQPLPDPFHELRPQYRPLRDPVDEARPCLLPQPFLQRSQRRVLARAALRLHPPVPADPRWRDRHHLQENHLVTGPDPLRPRYDQRRPVTLAQRPARRRHQVRDPHRHHQRPAARHLPAAGGTRRNKVQRHKRLLGRRVI